MTASSSPGTSMKKHRLAGALIAGCLLLTLSAPATGANLKADLWGTTWSMTVTRRPLGATARTFVAS